MLKITIAASMMTILLHIGEPYALAKDNLTRLRRVDTGKHSEQ